MSFEDISEVQFDDDEGTFTMVNNSGYTRTYHIDDEPDLVQDILDHGDEVDIIILSSEDVDDYGNRFFS